MLLLKMILLYESTLLIVIGTIAKKTRKAGCKMKNQSKCKSSLVQALNWFNASKFSIFSEGSIVHT